MKRSSPCSIPSVVRNTGLLPLVAVLLVLPACDSSPTDNGDDHSDGERVELHTGSGDATLRAVWTGEDGWEDADGASLTELPDPVVSGGALVPLSVGGDPADLTVRFFSEDGDVIDMSTVGQDSETGERTCSEYSVRYYPLDDATSIVAWPNVEHPDGPEGHEQFARRADGEVVQIFRCDHVRVYPEAAGTVELEFHLWHLGHSDGSTDPLRVRVEAAAASVQAGA